MKKTVVELFAGVGGFRVGLNNVTSIDDNGKAIENGDWEFVWANQWEPSTVTQHAFDCYVKRFGNHGEVSNEDIASVDKTRIPDHSLLVGGFPCQDYSVARSKVNEKGIEGKKGVLFWQIVEILDKKKTPFVLLENVDRLLKSPAAQRGRDFGIMLRTLSDLGYNVEWRVINAADYGAAQRRRRVFIFAWRRDLSYGKAFGDSIDVIMKSGLFGSTFPVISQEIELKKSNTLNINEMKDTVEMTGKFEHPFGNSGVLLNGFVTTFNVLPISENPITLRQIQDKSTDLSSYFLTEKQIQQFEFLKMANA
jgi:DNA (cytosine-5)-methyltransferase 1